MTIPNSFRFILFPLITFFAAQAHVGANPEITITPGTGDMMRIGKAEAGALRFSSGREISEVPEVLQGLPTVSIGRGRNTEPGAEFSFSVDKPVVVFIAVFFRGNYVPQDDWKFSGLTLGWEDAEDPIYVKEFPAGEVIIPAHDGVAGLYGPPHLAIVSSDLEAARALVAEAPEKYTRAPAPQPGYFWFDPIDAVNTGGYFEAGQPTQFRFEIRRGDKEKDPKEVRLSIKEEQGEFTFEASSPVGEDRKTEVFEVSLPRQGFYRMELDFDRDAFVREYQSGLAVLPPAAPVSRASPWGVMKAGQRPNEAKMARRLGVSWLRHSLWLQAEPVNIVEGHEPKVEVKMDRYLEKAREYKAEGIYILSGFQMIPREMSSRPDDISRSQKSGDAGPKYLRVPPKDYAVWRAYVSEIVRQSKGLIDAWEVGNEPNMPDSYWGGTTDEFAEWFNETVAGIKAADPDAVIVGPGFTLEHSALPFFQRMLELGNGEHLDVLSVHSLYGKQVTVPQMRQVLEKHGLGHLPIWSTEPKHPIPLRNFIEGIAVNTHFLLFPPGADFYDQFQNLARGDMAATRGGLAFALGASIIGEAQVIEAPTIAVPDVELALFEKDGTQVLAVQADEGPRGAKLEVEIEGEGARYTTALARTTELNPGKFEVPLDASGFVHGASRIVVGSPILPERTTEDGIDVSITEAELRNGFTPRHHDERGHWAATWAPAEKVDQAARPEVVFPIDLPEAGTYEFYVNIQWMSNLYKQLTSPVEWSVGGKEYFPVNETTAHWRRSTREYLRFGLISDPKNPTIPQTSVMCMLGSQRRLPAGPNTLHIRLTGPRAHDNAFNAEIGDLTFRQITDDME
jgi:hypothetical protein